MEYRTLGRTGIQVSRLGIGLAEIGETATELPQVARLLNTALDAGINFLDTAACYGNSEELIGETVANRRDDYVLATKCGHVTGDSRGDAWTQDTIKTSVERSLTRLRTDHLDLLQLHSCSLEILQQGEVIEALQEARQAGKTRFIGYSGDNEAALWAIQSGVFDSLQTSFNLVDQRARTLLFEQAQNHDVGLIVKRPIANGVWGSRRKPSSYSREYHERAKAMRKFGRVGGAPRDSVELALQFVTSHEAVDTAIVGTRSPEHLLQNIHTLDRGPLTNETIDELYRRFEELDQGWHQLL